MKKLAILILPTLVLLSCWVKNNKKTTKLKTNLVNVETTKQIVEKDSNSLSENIQNQLSEVSKKLNKEFKNIYLSDDSNHYENSCYLLLDTDYQNKQYVLYRNKWAGVGTWWCKLPWVEKIWVMWLHNWKQDSDGEYVLKSYNSKNWLFKYVMSEKYWNLWDWENEYEFRFYLTGGKVVKEKLNKKIWKKLLNKKNKCLITKNDFKNLVINNPKIYFWYFDYYCIPKNVSILNNGCFSYTIDNNVYAEINYCLNRNSIQILEWWDAWWHFNIMLHKNILTIKSLSAWFWNWVGEYPILWDKIISNECNLNTYKCKQTTNYVCKDKWICKNYSKLIKIIKEKCGVEDFDMSRIPTKSWESIQVSDECYLGYEWNNKYYLLINESGNPTYEIDIENWKITNEWYNICWKWFNTSEEIYNLTWELAIWDLVSWKCKFIKIEKYNGYYANGYFIKLKNISKLITDNDYMKTMAIAFTNDNKNNYWPIKISWDYIILKNIFWKKNVIKAKIKYFNTKYGKSFLLYYSWKVLKMTYADWYDGWWTMFYKTFLNWKEIK